MKKMSKPVVKKASVKPASVKKTPNSAIVLIPGEIILGEGDIIALHGRQTLELTVSDA